MSVTELDTSFETALNARTDARMNLQLPSRLQPITPQVPKLISQTFQFAIL